MTTPHRSSPVTHLSSKDLPLVSDSRVTVVNVPTESRESDGTFVWNSTTLILVEVEAKDLWGVGFTYGHAALKPLIEDLLKKSVQGKNVLEIPQIWGDLGRQIRNNGEVGLTAMAISAIDTALWDLKAKCLKLSLSDLWGRAKSKIEVYGSGGFTNYTDEQLEKQFVDWMKLGIKKFKMKVGTDPDVDPSRVRKAREIIGGDSELMVDANGGYDFQTALKLSEDFSKCGVTWFEQPIDPFNLDGMRELKRRLPPGMNLASGEYIYDLSDLQYGIENQAQDFIQLDATRCKGFSGFMKGAATCEASRIPISSHCAPHLHIALGCAFENFRHIEYFSDHARIEHLYFKGAPEVKDGYLSPNLSALGHGLVPNFAMIEKHAQ